MFQVAFLTHVRVHRCNFRPRPPSLPPSPFGLARFAALQPRHLDWAEVRVVYVSVPLSLGLVHAGTLLFGRRFLLGPFSLLLARLPVLALLVRLLLLPLLLIGEILLELERLEVLVLRKQRVQVRRLRRFASNH